MDVIKAVQEQANYPGIVRYFQAVKEPDLDQLVLMADVTGRMSDQIYEHYRAMCDLLKKELQRMRRSCAENGCQAVFPEPADREKAAYVIRAACRLGAVLPEKYEELLMALQKTDKEGKQYAE